MLDRRTLLKVSANAGLLAVFPALTMADKVKKPGKKRAELHEYCRAIPKAELHVHLSGIIYPDVALALASKNGVGPLSFNSVEQFYAYESCDPDPCVSSSEEDWYKFFTFLDELMGTIKVAEDVHEVVMQWVKRSGLTSNLRYAELTVPHPRFHNMSISLQDYFTGLQSAQLQAKRDYGIEINYIGSLFLYESVQNGVDAVKEFNRHKGDLPLIAVTGYNENVQDITVLSPVYDLAAGSGYRRPMHVGLGEPHSVKRMWDAVTKLEIERIDHGYMAVNDEQLMNYIAEKQIPVTMCPTIPARGAVYAEGDPWHTWNWNDFPFKTFYEKGLLVSAHTDVPAIANTTLGDAYIALVDHYEFNKNDVIALAGNSFKSSFLPSAAKQSYLNEIETWVKTNT